MSEHDRTQVERFVGVRLHVGLLGAEFERLRLGDLGAVGLREHANSDRRSVTFVDVLLFQRVHRVEEGRGLRAVRAAAADDDHETHELTERQRCDSNSRTAALRGTAPKVHERRADDAEGSRKGSELRRQERNGRYSTTWRDSKCQRAMAPCY